MKDAYLETAFYDGYFIRFMLRHSICYGISSKLGILTDEDYKSWLNGWECANEEHKAKEWVEWTGNLLEFYLKYYSVDEFEFIFENFKSRIENAKYVYFLKIHGPDTDFDIINKLSPHFLLNFTRVKSIVPFRLYLNEYELDGNFASKIMEKFQADINNLSSKHVNIELLKFQDGKFVSLFTLASE